KQYGKILEKYSINFSFLVTPETSEERIKYLHSLSSGFMYAVSSSSTTGNANATLKNVDYLSRLASLNLKNPVYVGFGIKNKQDFDSVTENLQGGIIGTAFVKVLLENKNWESEASNFVKSILS
ncbi:MAG: tryptophan synthase subunit alpha, partial [Soonwooa sp.]